MVIAAAALLITQFPLSTSERVPWYAPIVKAVGAIVFLALSIYLCRQVLRALGIGQPPAKEDHGYLAIVNILARLALTVAVGFFSIGMLLFSHGDGPNTPYWPPVIIGGTVVLIFAVSCWIWWGSIILGQALLRAGNAFSFFAGALPILLVLAVALVLLVWLKH